MKKILITSTAILIAATAIFMWKRMPADEHHGLPFTGLPPAAIADLATRPADFLGRPVSITGRLLRQCPATGCWFFLVDPADSKARTVKVDMGDTISKLPQHVGGIAHVEGQLIQYGDGYEFIGVAVTFGKNERP